MEQNAKGSTVVFKNDTLAEIAKALTDAEKVLIYTHQNMDGDALGSSCALAHNLRLMGKECWVLLDDDDIQSNLMFLTRDYCTVDESVIDKADVSLVLDAHATNRFPQRKNKFEQGTIKIAVDHHEVRQTEIETDPELGFDIKYIDKDTAATGELVYLLLKEMGAEIDCETAEALYTAIITDTGRFTYSNTSARSHEIVAELYKKGIDASRIATDIYENDDPKKILMQARVISNMEILCGGKLAMSKLTQQILAETGAKLSDTEGIVATLRTGRGVEIAAFLKEDENGDAFVSLRSKYGVDVSKVANELGGGGHEKAAGATLHMGIDDAYETVKSILTRVIREQSR